MSVKPILFSAPMVRALLEGRKTQTRRVLKPTKRDAECLMWLEFPEGREFYNGCADGSHVWPDGNEYPITLPYAPGDLLWVKENHRLVECDCTETCRVPGMAYYDADLSGYQAANLNKLRPSIFMPRWASRLTLEVTGVKVERLQEISNDDALAEGVTRIRDNCHAIKGFDYDLSGLCHTSPVTPYAKLWDHLNGPGSWGANPFVVAVTFQVHQQNVDAYLAQHKDRAA